MPLSYLLCQSLSKHSFKAGFSTLCVCVEIVLSSDKPS